MGRGRLGPCYSQPGPGFKTDLGPSAQAGPEAPGIGASGPGPDMLQSVRFTVAVAPPVTAPVCTVEVAVVVLPSPFRVLRTACRL